MELESHNRQGAAYRSVPALQCGQSSTQSLPCSDLGRALQVSIFDQTTSPGGVLIGRLGRLRSIKSMVVDFALVFVAAFTFSLLVYGFVYTVSDLKQL